MYSIEILEKEHEYILQLTEIMKSVAISVMRTGKAEWKDLELITEFIKNYSDFQHHGKEEKILFNYMLKHCGKVAEKLVNNGMMVEHDLARLYVAELKNCIEKLKNNENSDEILVDIIGHLMEYSNLLKRHAEKENTVVYPYALRSLPKEILEAIDLETEKFEVEYSENRETQLNNLNALKNKYLL